MIIALIIFYAMWIPFLIFSYKIGAVDKEIKRIKGELKTLEDGFKNQEAAEK